MIKKNGDWFKGVEEMEDLFIAYFLLSFVINKEER